MTQPIDTSAAHAPFELSLRASLRGSAKFISGRPSLAEALLADDPSLAPAWFQGDPSSLVQVAFVAARGWVVECFKAACQPLAGGPFDESGLDPLALCVMLGWIEGAAWALKGCRDPREPRGPWGSPWERAQDDQPMADLLSGAVRALDDRDQLALTPEPPLHGKRPGI